jgi:hypothetical protein
MKKVVLLGLMSCLVMAASASAVVLPTGPHAFFNFIPFGSNDATMHQVFDKQLFADLIGGQPLARIDSIGFAPNNTLAGRTFNQPVAIRLGTTTRVPGVGSPAGLSVPDPGGGGTPNASGPMTDFFVDPNWQYTVIAGGSENFEMVFAGTPFFYDPSTENLLVEIVTNGPDLSVSRTAGSPEASRAFNTARFGAGESPTTATRMDFTVVGVPEPASLLLLALGAVLIRRR